MEKIERIFLKMYQYDHELVLPSSGVNILTAPNGYGKSTILKIVDAVVNGIMHEELKEIEFEAKLVFNDNTVIECNNKNIYDVTICDITKNNITQDDFVKLKEIVDECFDITNKKFVYASCVAENAKFTDYNGKELPYSRLSDGEKSLFELYLNAIKQKNGIVISDNPENYLHIEWQELYINHLLNICKLNNIQALVATHSPSILHGHRDLLIQY